MNYALAKKLKDAGFPQNKGNKFYCLHGDYKDCDGTCADRDGDLTFIPTLSELIEACGERFGALHLDIKWEACGGKYTPMDQDCSWEFMIEGETPEEAVANLWLELNKK